MKIKFQNDRFVVESTYQERNIPKAAGCRWDPAKKIWYTTDVSVAAKLMNYAEDDQTRDQLTTAIKEQEKAVEVSQAEDSDIEIPCNEGMAYLPFQKAGIAYASVRDNVLIADSMGLGKTVQAVGICNLDPSVKSVLIICPASLKLNWRREFRKWDVKGLSVGVANGMFPHTDVVIINYDLLKKFHTQVRARVWCIMIVDEAHYLKNPKAQRTIAVIGKKEKDEKKTVTPIKANKKVFLTGTPILNRPAEAWTICNFLAPNVFNNWFQFVKRYASAFQNRYGWDTSGASNLQELQIKLRESIMVRRLKEDVLKDLPAKRRQVIEFSCEDGAVKKESAAWQAHQDHLDRLKLAVELAKAESDSEYDEAVRNLKEGTLAAFTEMAKMRHETALAKVPFVISHVEDAIEGGKVVLFAHHRDVIDKFVTHFGKACVRVTGEDSIENRQKAVDAFQKDPNITLFVGNIKAAGVGLTLTASAHVIFAELDWVPGNMTQAEDRCILQGQLILTPTGWVPIETIKIGDEVITASGVGNVVDAWNKGNLKQVTETIIEGWHSPIITTYDHLFLLTSGNWRAAGDLRPGDKIAMPSATLQYTKSIYFDDDCRIESKFNGAGGYQRNGRLLKAPKNIILSEEALFTFGYFVGDGFSSINSDKGRFISFAGHKEKDIAAHAVCKRWCELQGMRLSIRYSDGLGMEMRAYSGEWAFWFRKHFGHTAHKKRLPVFLMSLEVNQSRSLLDGLIASDGYRRNGYVEYVTASSELASQVARLIINADYIPTVRSNTTGQFVVSFSESGCGTAGLVRSVTNRFPKKINGQRERVYDLTIDVDSSFVVGLSVVHNCHRIGQKGSVLVQHLVLEGSLDATMANTLIDKQQVIEKALDNPEIIIPEAQEVVVPDPEVVKEEMLRPATTMISKKKIEQDAVDISREEIEDIHRKLRYLAAVCDGAHSIDGAGFNKMDAGIGKSFASQSSLSPRQAVIGRKLVTKYRRQLANI